MEEDPATWLIRWAHSLEPFFRKLDEKRRIENEEYRKALIEKIQDDPVNRVIRFFNLVDQGFHLIFGDMHPVFAIREEDLL